MLKNKIYSTDKKPPRNELKGVKHYEKVMFSFQFLEQYYLTKIC